jgi:hypothetical protein
MSGEGKAEFEQMCHDVTKEQLGEGSDKYQKYLEKRDKKKADKAKVRSRHLCNEHEYCLYFILQTCFFKKNDASA